MFWRNSAHFVVYKLKRLAEHMSNPLTTSSGRTVKRTGMNDSKRSALQKIKAAREGGIKRTDQYEVSIYLPKLK